MHSETQILFYQSLANIVVTLVPDDWNSVHLRTDITQKEAGYDGFCMKTNGERENFFATEELNKLVCDFWNNLDDQWTVFYFVLSNDGKFNVEYEYDVNPYWEKE